MAPATRCGSGESYFNVPSGSAGEETAQALADYLKRKGWQVQYAKVAPPVSDNRPDIVLSGKILDMAVEAKGGLLFTDIGARNKLTIQGKNRSDDSSISDTVAHSGTTHSVFWFEPQDGRILSEGCWKRTSNGLSSIPSLMIEPSVFVDSTRPD
ncbi:MAG: hypothetical protein U0231_11805 [Nitrospiraceae bacterium]